MLHVFISYSHKDVTNVTLSLLLLRKITSPIGTILTLMAEETGVTK